VNLEDFQLLPITLVLSTNRGARKAQAEEFQTLQHIWQLRIIC
jgi:hypothetical protein